MSSENSLTIEMNSNDNDTVHSYWVSANAGGKYRPYHVVDISGRLYLTSGIFQLEPKSWQELLILVSEDTAKSREDNA